MNGVVITPPGRYNTPDWRDLWASREVLWRFGHRDIVLRYRQTALGVAWVLLQPLASAGIFSIIFGVVAGLQADGVPYFVFAYMGMLAWNLFSSIVSRSASSLVGNQALVAKVFFPRILVPLSSALSAWLDFVVSLALGLVLLLVYGIAFTWSILLIPALVCMLTLFGLGIGVAASAIMVKYRDVAYVLPWVLQIGLLATPIAYSASAVPSQASWFFQLNPLAWFMEGFRWMVLGTAQPPWWQLLACAVVSLATFAWGVSSFQRRERAFADVI